MSFTRLALLRIIVSVTGGGPQLFTRELLVNASTGPRIRSRAGLPRHLVTTELISTLTGFPIITVVTT
jgi:hypothetical protein